MLRSLFLCALFSLAVSTNSIEEGSGMEQIQETGKSIVNWDYKDIVKRRKTNSLPPSAAAGSANVEQGQLLSEEQSGKMCPDGWIHFEESCYLVSKDKLSMDKAEQACFAMDTTMFVANTVEEWDLVRSLAPSNAFTWIGLFKDTRESPLKWQIIDGMNTTNVHFLTSPSLLWTPLHRCVAHYLSSVPTASYANFLPCSFPYNFICERNSTIHEKGRTFNLH